MIDLTIVIASYETHDLLMRCLLSVDAACRAHPALRVETIVVDNGSRDGSVAAVKKQYPHVRVFASVRNQGFAAAINVGMRARHGRMVLLLNSDTEIDQDLLADGVGILDGHPSVAIVGAALFHSDGRSQRSVHPLPGLMTESLPEFVLRIFRPRGFEERSKRGRSSREPDLQKVEAVRGAVFLIRADVIEELGPFSERFFFFLEETEYCARVRRAGYEILFAREMKAVHALGASSKRRAPLVTRIEFHRSLYRFLELRGGKAVASYARGLRFLRGGALLILMGLAYPFSSDVRRRWPERMGLFLWHLRGCPDEPRLADVLEALNRDVGEVESHIASLNTA